MLYNTIEVSVVIICKLQDTKECPLRDITSLSKIYNVLAVLGVIVAWLLISFGNETS